jgi:hypothetical protein
MQEVFQGKKHTLISGKCGIEEQTLLLDSNEKCLFRLNTYKICAISENFL